VGRKRGVFGPIEYSSDQWEGEVRVPFFAAYDHAPSFFDNLPDWKLKLIKEGRFDLVVQDEAGEGPSPSQKRAFTHFQENQDAICAEVVAAIFPYYQKEYESRELTTLGVSQAELEKLFPAIVGVEGLKTLIRFRTFYVLEGIGQWDIGGTKPETWVKLDHWALLGFAFSCIWDSEHGLGVVYHKNKVVGVGDSSVTWDGPGDF
jgi:hypothetical protein